MNAIHFSAILALFFSCCNCKEKTAVEKQAEALQKEWDTIYKVWCHQQDLPEEVIDDAYDCFGNASGKEDFDIQIKCENEIFPDSMSKNDVRRAMCKSDPKIIAKFDKCFAANKKVNKTKKKLTKEEQKKQDLADLQKLAKLVNCMKRVFAMDEQSKKKQETTTTAANSSSNLKKSATSTASTLSSVTTKKP